MLESVWANAVRQAPVAQQRPGPHRDDRSLVRPVLGKLAPTIDQVVEARPVVGSQTREQYLILCRHQDGDVVDLEQSEPMDDLSQVTHVDASPWAGPVEPLCGQGDPTRLARRQGSGHENQTLTFAMIACARIGYAPSVPTAGRCSTR